MRKLDIKYQNTKLSDNGETFIIKKYWHPIIDSWNPLYNDILEEFDSNKYTCPRLPISMGPIDSKIFDNLPNVLRLPIKYNNSNEIRLPKELLPLKEEIIRILQYDYHINSYFEDFFVHITIDNSIVKPQTSQRFPGFHGDGLQGGKFKKKLIVEHSYIFVNNNPTEIALQPFFVSHINEDRYNIFKEFDKQLNKSCLYKTLSNHLYLIDPYVVHASPVVEKETFRTFFRLTVASSELLMPKNTINPLFDGQAYPERIDVREFVSDPDIEVPYYFYGIQKY